MGRPKGLPDLPRYKELKKAKLDGTWPENLRRHSFNVLCRALAGTLCQECGGRLHATDFAKGRVWVREDGKYVHLGHIGAGVRLDFAVGRFHKGVPEWDWKSSMKFVTLAEMERGYILEVVESTKTLMEAARVLGIHRVSLGRRLDQYRQDEDDEKDLLEI